MDLLSTAMVDVTTLVATCHALKSGPAEDAAGEGLQRKLRSRLRRDIRRGTVAYIDTLARTRLGVVDAVLLVKCRVAAGRQMPRAIAHQGLLCRIMTREAGSLDGMAAARQDLWRLAHVAVHLGTAMATLRGAGAIDDAKPADALAARLRRRVRKAMVAYARTALRTKARKGRLVLKAREAALAEIGPRGAAEAERLADLKAGGVGASTVLRDGVAKPLLDLGLDWQRAEPEATEGLGWHANRRTASTELSTAAGDKPVDKQLDDHQEHGGPGPGRPADGPAGATDARPSSGLQRGPGPRPAALNSREGAPQRPVS